MRHTSSPSGRTESAVCHLNVRARNMYVCLCVCIYIYIHVYIYTCVYIYIYIYTIVYIHMQCICAYCTKIKGVFAFSEVQAVHWPWQAIS